jgi:hypothetical protein
MNTQYLLRGIFLLLPTWGILRKTHFMEWRSLAIAGLFLSLSLGFRLLDKVSIEWLPMGTHFLWHLMSASICCPWSIITCTVALSGREGSVVFKTFNVYAISIL